MSHRMEAYTAVRGSLKYELEAEQKAIEMSRGRGGAEITSRQSAAYHKGGRA